MTGSSGGDNSTNNTTTFKEGSNLVDSKAQNLIANNGNATKIWTLSPLAISILATKPYGLWLYIKDATALAKFKVAGTALTIKLATDSSNYYYQTFTVANLATGWNWISTNTVLVSSLSTTGTPATLSQLIIEVITNNATDTFVAGDVVYDLLRQWNTSDVNKDFIVGYPTFDYVNNEITTKCYLNTIESTGFLINELGIFNKDTAPLISDDITFSAQSKSSTDEFIWTVKNRII